MVLKQPLQIFNGFWGDHHHWMFFGGLTIAINGFSMFFYFATIAFNGFRWFRTIGQSMRWFRWIVVVSYRPWIQLFYLKKMKQYSHFWKQYSRFCNLSRLLLAEGFKPNDRRDNTSFNFTTQLRKRALCCGLQAYLAIFNTNIDAFKF